MTNSNNQPDEITIKIEKSTLVLDDLNRFYDAGAEFNISFSGNDIIKILTKNQDIALDLLRWGNDTCVGDSFFEAFVEDVLEESFNTAKEKYGDRLYAVVEEAALKKGYSPTT